MSEGTSSCLNKLKEKYPDYLKWLLLSIIILFSISIRVRLLEVPLERDEAEYAFSARLLLEGIPLYTESTEFLKMPGLYALYAIFLSVFGNSIIGIHLGLLVVNTLTIILMYFFGKRLCDDTAGLMAAASFAIMSVSNYVLGFTTNAEPLLLLPTIGALLFLLSAVETKRRSELFFCGLLLGLAYVIKQPAAFFIMFAGLYIIYTHFKAGQSTIKVLITKLLIYSAGVFLPFITICILLLFSGVFDKFWFWTYEFALTHGGALPFTLGLTLLKTSSIRVLNTTLLFYCLAAVGFAAIFYDKKLKEKAVFTILLLLFSFFAVSLGLYYRLHYFILIIPVISLLTGFALSFIAGLLKKNGSGLVIKTLPIILALIVISFTLIKESAYLFSRSPENISRTTYGSNPFVEAIEISKYIKENSTKDDRIEVIGSEPEIYFYSDRRAASKYAVIYTMIGSHKYALEMQKDYAAQVEAARPKFIIYVSVATSWAMPPEAEKWILGWVNLYVSTNYDLVGVIDINRNDPSKFMWDEDAVGIRPESKNWISVYRIKGS